MPKALWSAQVRAGGMGSLDIGSVLNRGLG